MAGRLVVDREAMREAYIRALTHDLKGYNVTISSYSVEQSPSLSHYRELESEFHEVRSLMHRLASSMTETHLSEKSRKEKQLEVLAAYEEYCMRGATKRTSAGAIAKTGTRRS